MRAICPFQSQLTFEKRSQQWNYTRWYERDNLSSMFEGRPKAALHSQTRRLSSTPEFCSEDWTTELRGGGGRCSAVSWETIRIKYNKVLYANTSTEYEYSSGLLQSSTWNYLTITGSLSEQHASAAGYKTQQLIVICNQCVQGLVSIIALIEKLKWPYTHAFQPMTQKV